MQGCVRQRSKGSWQIIWELPRGADGKRQPRSMTIRGTKSAAQAKLREILGSLDHNSYVDPTPKTLDEYLESWLGKLEATHAPKTREDYARLLRNHVIPTLGKTPLQRLTADDIESLQSRLLREGRRDGGGGLSQQSVRHVHAVLSAALTRAVKLKLISSNPVRDAEAPAEPHREQAVLDAEQTRAVLAAARGSVMEPVVLLAAAAGLRRGECLGMKWGDLDLESGRATVRRSRYQVPGTVGLKEPKSGKARMVVLPAFVLPDLRRIKGEQAQRRLRLGNVYDDGGWVCCWENGAALRPDYVSHAFSRLLRDAGLPAVTLHSLRHGYATFLLQENVHPKVVAEALGHSSTAVTLRVYSHVVGGLMEEAAERLNRALGG